MKGLVTAFCLILACAQASLVVAGDHPPTKRQTSNSATNSKELVWNANPAEEGITSYNVYQRIDNGNDPPRWKKIGTVREPKFTVKRLKKGSHVFAVSACSKFGESARTELVVTR